MNETGGFGTFSADAAAMDFVATARADWAPVVLASDGLGAFSEHDAEEEVRRLLESAPEESIVEWSRAAMMKDDLTVLAASPT